MVLLHHRGQRRGGERAREGSKLCNLRDWKDGIVTSCAEADPGTDIRNWRILNIQLVVGTAMKSTKPGCQQLLGSIAGE